MMCRSVDRSASSIHLASPCREYEASYRRMIQEFSENNEPLVPFVLAFPCDDFSELINNLESCSKGIDIPRGFVPHSTFWLVDRDRNVLGVVNLRHALTDRLRREGGHIGYGIRPSARRRGYGSLILKLSLDKARELGLDRVLITCSAENIGSIGVIRNNGGQYDSEEFMPERDEVVQRYWIEL